MNYDFLASEGHYHRSCYREYTRPKASLVSSKISAEEENKNLCSEVEEIIFQKWFQYIRSDIIKNGKVVTLAFLTKVLDKLLYENSCNPESFTNKSFRRKSNRRLELEFDGLAEIYLGSKGKLIFLPNSKSRNSLASELVELQQTVEKSYGISNKSTKKAEHMALALRTEIKFLHSNMSWPPKLSELDPDSFEMPSLLNHFLSHLLHGNSKSSAKTSSIGQDIICIVHKGKLLIPKHVLLPFTIKSMTGNIELIKIMNKLGHSISYSKLYEVDTAYAVQKLLSSLTLIPEGIQSSCQVSLVYDNIDRLEETLSGGGTTHRVNGIVIQRGIIGPKLPTPTRILPNTKQRIVSVEHLQLPIYNVGTPPEPPLLPNVDATPLALTEDLAFKKNYIWLLCRHLNSENQSISSWTGFNMLVRRDLNILKDSICLPLMHKQQL